MKIKLNKNVLNISLALAVMLALMGTPAAHAAGVIVVNSDTDVIADDGVCTLREAITAANSDTASGATPGECIAGAGPDSITFAADYTITLVGSQLPAVTSEMTITGNGAANTIIQADAAANTATYRVFEVAPTGNLTLDGVTVRHGRCAGGCATISVFGGGILNDRGMLTVTNSTLSGNSASSGGGIANRIGMLTVTDSTLSGNSASIRGGGIANLGGTLTVTDSTLSGNSARNGGGISNLSGTVTVTDSTLSGNSALEGGGIHNFLTAGTTVINSTLSGNSASTGGGIYNTSTQTVINSTLTGNSAIGSASNTGNGGGIYNQATLTVINSTLSGNKAIATGDIVSTESGNGGGIYKAGGTLTMTNSTLFGNSASNAGGIYNYGGVQFVTNSTLSGNSASTGVDEVYNELGFTANAFNVFGHSGQSNADAFFGFSPGASDFNATTHGTPTALAAILDTTLADNGGPTQTHALVAGSPAIDFAGACGLATDQRGVVRPQGAACDAGAFELATNQPPTAVAGGPYLVAVNSSIAFDGSGSSDPDGDSLTETWTAAGGSVAGNTYTAGSEAGIFDVCLTVNDGTVNSEPNCTIVVVYDPSGGFVTGGGWIDSPVNTDYQYMQTGGKATFGFVAKYQKGANVPDGNTEFQFKAGNLNFKSSSYEWLVVAGSQAMFKGEGTINGEGSYKFMISADDGATDTFRIKIWYEENGTEVVVYDNGSQQSLGGGSIVVHSK